MANVCGMTFSGLALVTTTCGLLVSGCGNLPGFRVEEKADSFKQAYTRKDKIDVLFVIDNSGSMAQEQANLAASFQTFIDGFVDRGLDYHIGVISTDPTANGNWWLSANAGVACAAYCGIFNAGPGTLLSKTNGVRYLAGNSASTAGERANIVTQFQDNVQVGIAGSGAEAGLLSVVNFLDAAKLASGGWNNGFLREDAYLSIIIVSDENESIGSGGSPANYVSGASLTTRLAAFKSAVTGVKTGDEEGRYRVDAIVGPTSPVCGSALGAGAAYEAAVAENNGVAYDICTSFGTNISSIGDALVVATTRFKLKQPPDGAIKVYVNNVEVPQDDTNGWHWYPDTLEVEFRGTAIPGENAEISVAYIPLAPTA